MAVPFPLPLAAFFDLLQIEEFSLAPSDPIVTSRTRGGEVLTAQVGNVLWQGSVSLVQRYHDDADRIAAMLALLRRPGASFMVSPPHRFGPIADPDGSILGTAEVEINAINMSSNPRATITLRNLPVGYVLSPGDLFSVEYGSDPVRYSMHRLLNGKTIAGSGISGGLDINPPLPVGIASGMRVTLYRPVIKAVMAQAPRYGSFRPVFVGGVGFDFVQTFGD